jgi:uncharacterized membrane protein YqgA involved in biofilm formation
MLGTLLNCGGIIIGGLAGLLLKREMPQQRQLLLRVIVGVAAVWFGFSIAIKALTLGTWQYAGKLFLIMLLSMTVGRVIGKLCRLQAMLNRAGQFSKQKLASGNRNDGLLAAIILFSAAPLGVIGAIEDGLANQFRPLLVKGLIDGLGAYSFARMYGWRTLLAVIPLAGTLVLIASLAQAAAPWLEQRNLVDPIHVVCGFLVVYVSLIVFEVKKVELGDYLPAIAVAPALTLLFQ